MIRHSLALLLFTLAIAAACAAVAPAADGQPNIVVFLADDLGWADVPWHGSRAHMPSLAALAKESVKLEAHYVHPMCSPTRAALLTGRYASRFGVTGAQNERALRWNTVTLASALQAAGYETAITGKWHLGSQPDEGPQKFGFDHGYGSLAGGCGPYDHRYKEGPFTRTWHRNAMRIEEEGHVTDLIAREAVQWVEARGQRPFFLYVPFTAIHVPMNEPEKWREQNNHLSDPGQRLRAACATHMDDAIGQVLAALDRKNSAKRPSCFSLATMARTRRRTIRVAPTPASTSTIASATTTCRSVVTRAASTKAAFVRLVWSAGRAN
jgi:hypothetical protein